MRLIILTLRRVCCMCVCVLRAYKICLMRLSRCRKDTFAMLPVLSIRSQNRRKCTTITLCLCELTPISTET